MERGCFNCAHKDDSAWLFRCAKCAEDGYFLWMEKKQTNADKIRQMSDEELAEWMLKFAEQIAKQATDNYVMEDSFAKDALDWLKQEVESDEL